MPAFKSLRQDEDYGFLREASPATFPECLKYLAAYPPPDSYFSFGGEARWMPEGYRNDSFSKDPADDTDYFLQRYLLHADYHGGEHFRAFFQLQSAFESGKPGHGDANALDIHQLFIDLRTKGEDPLTARIGRQELSFGSERLIGTREGTNNRRAFDAARVFRETETLRIDAFAGAPVEWDAGVLDDQAIDGSLLWGLYATWKGVSGAGTGLDLYYLGIRRDDAEFSQGTGDETRHTAGVRYFGKAGSWDFNQEAMVQAGSFDDGRILAWSLATDQGYTFGHVPWEPRLGLKAAVASGDRDAADPRLETFNPLYPRGNYFTEASLLGPQNFMDLRPNVSVSPAEDLTFELGVDFYWRQSTDDGIYHPSGSLIYDGKESDARFVGTDISLSVEWRASRHLTLGAAYTWFRAGDFICDSGGDDVGYASAWLTWRF